MIRPVPRIATIGAKFLAVGAVSTVIEVAVFNLCLFVFQWDPVPSKLFASLVALVNAYFGNREFTFRGMRRRDRRVEVTLFLLANATCAALGAALIWLGISAVEWLTGAAPGALVVNALNLVSIGIVVIVRFALYHLVVFRGSSRSPSS